MDCSKAIIQSGIVKVVGATYKPIPENWLENLKKARTMLEEGGVEFIEFVRKDLATTH